MKLLTALLALTATATFTHADDAQGIKDAIGAIGVTVAASAPPPNQQITVVYTGGNFNTRTSTGGNTGFHLIDTNGNTIWEAKAPGDHYPCGYDRKFSLGGGCFQTPREFHCDADFSGLPEHCGISELGGPLIIQASGEKKTQFFGIGIAISSACSFTFELNPGEHCDAGQTDMVAVARG